MKPPRRCQSGQIFGWQSDNARARPEHGTGIPDSRMRTGIIFDGTDRRFSPAYDTPVFRYPLTAQLFGRYALLRSTRYA